MARVGDNPIGLCTNKTSFFFFLFSVSSSNTKISKNLLKFDQGRGGPK